LTKSGMQELYDTSGGHPCHPANDLVYVLGEFLSNYTNYNC